MVQTRLKLKLAHEVTLVLKIKIQTVRNSISFYRKQLESLTPKDSLTRHRRSKIDELMNEYA